MFLLLVMTFASADSPEAFFEKEVKPILTTHCLKCHGAEEKIKGGLKLTSRESILKGGDTGPAFDAKTPTESLILKAVKYKDEALQMPPKAKLDDKEIAIIEKWLLTGLAMPETKAVAAENKPKGGVVNEETKKYWAYQPVKKPAVPAGTAQRSLPDLPPRCRARCP